MRCTFSNLSRILWNSMSMSTNFDLYSLRWSLVTDCRAWSLPEKKQDIETPKELSFTRDLPGDVRSGHQFFHVRQFFCQSAANCNYTSFTNHSQQPSTWNSVLNKGKGVNQTICKDNPFESYYEAGHWHWNDRKTILALRHFCSKPTTEIKYWRYYKHCRYWIFVADSSNRINK